MIMFFGFWFVQIEFVENNKIVYKSSSKIGFSWPSFWSFSSIYFPSSYFDLNNFE